MIAAGSLSPRTRWITTVLFAFAVTVFLVDVVVSSSISLSPFLAVPVVVSALFVGARVTVVLSVFVVATGFGVIGRE